MRVALFSGNYNYIRDGANRALNRLVGFLEDHAGAEVRVYSPTSATPAFAPTGTLVSVPSMPFPGRPEYRLALRFPNWLKRDIADFRPDLFHLSAPDPLGYRALAFAEALGAPAVASLHTRFETYLDYYGFGWARFLGERYLRSFYGRCDYLLVPTPAIQRDMARDLGAERVRIWGRGVDTDMFASHRRSERWRKARGFREDEVVVTFFGRLVAEKGTDIFAETMQRLLGRGTAVRVMVIGDGPARAQMARALPQAHFTGMLSGDALAEALPSADILVNPSVTEAFGNVVLESMAAGLVPVCADVDSARNLVEHGVAGLLCTARDPGAYADAVRGLVSDRARLARMKTAAEQAASGRSWPDVFAEVVKAYGDAVAPAQVRQTPPPGPKPFAFPRSDDHEGVAARYRASLRR